MSSDGAHLGVSATKALHAVLGGEQPTETDMTTVAEMRERLLAAPNVTQFLEMADSTTLEDGYGLCAECCAGEILRWAMANPQRFAHHPVDTEYVTGPDGKVDWSDPKVARESVYEVMKKDGIALDKLGLTGFMWGWAYNAARRCLELPPVPNPAIITV